MSANSAESAKSGSNTFDPDIASPSELGKAAEADATCAFEGATGARLVEILEQYLADLKEGTAPSRQELLSRHPELAEQLDACLAGIDFIHRADQSSGDAPRQLGDFRILREIGRGGMGAVYEAQQLTLDRRVALKILRFGAISDPAAVDRFQREAETVARLHHTNIVPIFCVGQEKGVNYFVMQFIDGQSLADVFGERQAPIDVALVAQWGLQAAEALAHAHRRGVVHRDVKPSNLLLDREQRLWLTDFGLAKRLDDVTLSMTGALLGTPRYMSPEQAAAAHRQVDARTDIYSLGASLYELATGQPLFAGTSPHDVIQQILSVDPPPPRQVCPAISRDVETILMRCLAKEPEQRYESAEALASDLRAYLECRPIQARRASIYERGVRWLRRQRRNVLTAGSAAALTLVLAVSALLGWWGYQQHQLGFVRLTTDEGPLAVEVKRRNGQSTLARVTAPTLDPLSLPRGDYDLQFSGAGRLSESYRLFVDREISTEIHVDTDDAWLWSDLDIQHGYDLVRRVAGGHDIISYSPSGLEWFDGRNRQRNWLLPVTAPAHPRLAEWPRLKWQPFTLGFPLTDDVRQSMRPLAIPELADLNGDGAADLVVAGGLQAWLMAISGKDGEPLWLVDRDPSLRDGRASERQRQAGRAAPPQWTIDVNGDGVRDVVASFVSLESAETMAVRRWVEVFSGADGRALWRFDLPSDWFSHADVPLTYRWYTGRPGGGWSQGGSGSSTYLNIVIRGRGTVEPGDEHVFVQGGCHQFTRRAPDDSTAAVPLLGLVAGDRLVVLEAASGHALHTAALGLVPGLAAQWGDLDGDQVDDVVLLEKWAQGANYLSHSLAAYSVALDKPLWQQPITAMWPDGHTWGLPPAAWPVVEDLDGDGRCEVLLPHGTSAAPAGSTFSGFGQIPWGKLAVLRGSDGHQVWKQTIRTMDQQADCFVVGPDIDGDTQRDIFVATIWGANYDLYLDALSGRTGESLWYSRRALSRGQDKIDQYFVGHLHWQPSLGESHGMLVAVLHHDGSSVPLTQMFAARDGSWRHQALASQPQFADVNADGFMEILLAEGEGEGNTFHSRRLSCRRGMLPERWRRSGGTWFPAADLDGDGLTDLLQILDDQRFAAVSLSSGDVLWRVSDPLAGGKVRALHDSARSDSAASGPAASNATSAAGDLDGDGVMDLVAHVDNPHGFALETPIVHAFSGKSGRTLWSSAVVATSIRSVGPVTAGDDLDGDGRGEVFCLADSNAAGPDNPTGGEHWTLYVLRGRDGSALWQLRVTAESAAVVASHRDLEGSTYPFQLVDLDGDGLRDVVLACESEQTPETWILRAYRSTDGVELWSVPLSASTTPGYHFANIAPLVVTDVNLDDTPDVLLLNFTTDSGDDSRVAFHRHLVTTARLQAISGRDGSVLWKHDERVSGFMMVSAHTDYWTSQKSSNITILRHPQGVRLALALVDDHSRVVTLDRLGNRLSERPLATASGGAVRVMACDHDQDGQDELALIDQRLLMLVAPDRLDAPLWTSTLADEFSNSPTIHDVWPAQDGWPAMILVGQYFGETTVVGYAPENGRPIWRSPGRTSLGARWSTDGPPLLVARAESPQVGPLVFAITSRACEVRAGRWFDGEARAVESEPLAGLSSDFDPRFLRPLPWAYEVDAVSLDMVAILLRTLLLSALLVVLPAGYLTMLLWRGRWNMRWLLGLPLLLVLWVVAFTSRSNTALHLNDPWQKIQMALLLSPAVFALSVLARRLVAGRWKHVVAWLAFTVAATLAIGLVTVYFVAPLQHPRERYSLQGAYWLWFPVAFLISWFFSLWVIGRTVWQKLWRRDARPVAVR